MHVRRHAAGRLTAAVILGTLLASALALPTAAADGQAFVAAVNQKRAAHGRPPVAWHAAVDQVTVERGDQMAAADRLAHDLAYVERRLRELGVCFTGYGEIIYWERGYPSFDPARAVDAWYRSTSGHREIMLGDYNAASGSWSVNTSSNGVFAVMVFVKTCSTTPPPPGDPNESVRVYGADRYETAAALSAASFDPGVTVAYVATGATFPDALAAGPAAAYAGAPLLLVKRTEIPSVTAAELTRLQPKRIVLLGGTASVSNTVATALRSFTTQDKVNRIAGDDRYGTAALISKTHFSPGKAVVYVATGATFPDALAGGAVAGLHDGPILLVGSDDLPSTTAAELQRLQPARIVVLGGPTLVSDRVLQEIDALTGAAVSRVFGVNRYATAVLLSRANYAANGPSKVYVATGASFPDGLAGSAVAGSLPGPLLLVPSGSLPSYVAGELQRLAPDRVIVLGGTGVISNTVVQAINAVVP